MKSEELLAIREQIGLGRNQMANKLRCSIAEYRNYEDNKWKIPPDIILLANHINRTIPPLIKGKNGHNGRASSLRSMVPSSTITIDTKDIKSYRKSIQQLDKSYKFTTKTINGQCVIKRIW